MTERISNSSNAFTSGKPWEQVAVSVPPREVSEGTRRYEQHGSFPSGTGFGMADYPKEKPGQQKAIAAKK